MNAFRIIQDEAVIAAAEGREAQGIIFCRAMELNDSLEIQKKNRKGKWKKYLTMRKDDV